MAHALEAVGSIAVADKKKYLSGSCWISSQSTRSQPGHTCHRSGTRYNRFAPELELHSRRSIRLCSGWNRLVDIGLGFDPIQCAVGALVDMHDDLMRKCRMFADAPYAALQIRKIIPGGDEYGKKARGSGNSSCGRANHGQHIVCIDVQI